ncbi:ATP-grasp ribosomal peptide maturase [Fodinibacter luteus]|uniref:ATP-grasp ribosomal peptide maturase n=1 Tax=Fodinibacter luteus TaxID=552064 RepID=A0ABP8KFP3_9MICO
MILLVSHADDDHLAPVLSELARAGAEAVVVDTSRIPASTAVTAAHSAGGDGWWLRFDDGPSVDLAGCGAGWWRRALPAAVDDRVRDPGQALWAANETYEAMAGFWDSVPVAWVSPPRAVEKAMMKTWQLPAARAAGLLVPRTVVTSDPGRAREFIDELGLGRVICKAFSATQEHWRETRLVGPDEYDRLDSVAVAPVIFQEFVPAEVDLRVTVVGEQVFAAAIHSQELPYGLDFRLYLDRPGGVRMEPATLPCDVEDALLRLMTAAELRYGAFDLRRTPDGRHVFLEVNPAGQWLFVEQVTGQPITSAVSSLLARLDAA